MRCRAVLLTWVAAVAAVQTLATLPSGIACGGMALLAVVLLGAAWGAARICGEPYARSRKGVCTAAYCLAAACAGVAYASERAAWRLADALPDRHDNEVARVLLRVRGLPVRQADHVRFDADILQAVPGPVPGKIRVDWWAQGRDAVLPALAPGQVWQMALLLRRPYAALNPHAADASARLFHDGVRALASVRGRPRRVTALPGEPPLAVQDGLFARFAVGVDSIRHGLRERLSATLQGRRYGGVVIALALGDQTAIGLDDWTVFNATGVTHLVSISGLHVSLVAGLAGLAWTGCWRRLRWRGLGAAEWVPAQVAGGCAALGVAAIYCVLAGWGLPAQRTFFMLAVAVVAWILRLRWSPSRVLSLAAAIVTLIDPWAPLAAGFWLSFGAVAVLMASGGRGLRQPEGAAPAATLPVERQKTRVLGAVGPILRRQGARFWAGTRLQLTINVALAPVLAVLTQQLSLAAPLANAFAIPAISLVATPLALVATALHALPLADAWQVGAKGVALAAHAVIAWTSAPLAWLARQDWAVRPLAAPPVALLMLALAGGAWGLMRAAWPARGWGWLLLLPALTWRPTGPAPGAWSMTVLDVGQGGAAVVRTAGHVLLFDTGPRSRSGSDAGTRVVWPYLRAEGITRIDTLVVSHGDLDHAGGVGGVLAGAPVVDTYASFNLPARLRAGAYDIAEGALGGLERPGGHRTDLDQRRLGNFRRCRAGQSWTADGVRFDFLHPVLRDDVGDLAADKRGMAAAAHGGSHAGRSNDNGCVLRIQGRYHSALLPGDIGVDQEEALAATLGGSDVVLAPHHGSATSSGDALVQAARATHLVVQAGYRNRFGHPADRVLRRWLRAGADIWRTDQDGAVLVDSTADGLRLRALREERARYWHGR
ncbi:DNA internalization-related competence protein ComEC/Rec2 [Bordetella sp. N]|uniref:DNA internalization-related competence protein ComEC/Rec2 n=1 Tax=Bordetella sp. N TaxID=1746199 RepID=UPI0007097735|nr:DNA internalization-related competence protein ComEC/Rec2 [Bordetella sp. N]ALM82315.1 hypothetical protein ASB57_04465 [Bordetella sp. N]